MYPVKTAQFHQIHLFHIGFYVGDRKIFVTLFKNFERNYIHHNSKNNQNYKKKNASNKIPTMAHWQLPIF